MNRKPCAELCIVALCSRRKRATARIVTDGSETLCVATTIAGRGAGVPSVWAAAGRLGSRYTSSPAFPPSNTLANPTCQNACQASPFTINFHRKLAITLPISQRILAHAARAHRGGRGLAAIWHGTPTVSYNLQSYSPTVLQSYRPVLPTTYNLQSCKQDWNALVSHSASH